MQRKLLYLSKSKYQDRLALSNNVDPDQTLPSAVSDQRLCCLPFIQQFLNTLTGSKRHRFKF